MELRQFRYFVAVAEELHFSRAAKRLNIGQPPLSLQIQSIERELGVTLLNRNRRKVELTEAGRLFLVEARAVLAQAARAVETVDRAARGEVGMLRLSFVTSAPFTSVFTSVVRRFRMAMPDVHLEMHIQPTQRILSDLVLDRIELGVIRPAPSTPIPTDFRTIRLAHDRLMLVVPPDHPLAETAGPVPVERLTEENFILRQRGTGAGFYEQVFELCARAGFTPRIVQDVAEAPLTLGLVATGLGITISPASLRAIYGHNVVWRELAVGEEALSPLLLVLKPSQSSAPRDRFVAMLQQTLAEQDGVADECPAPHSPPAS